MTLKVGDYVVRKHFINFWPGQIIYVNPEYSYREKAKVFWFDKDDWEWVGNLDGLKRIPPLMLLAMQAPDA
jgi:hypothetical protein